MSLQELFNQYVKCVEQNDAAAAGDLVVDLDDETCRRLYDLLLADPRTKDNLVRPLWYNYRTQKLRWENPKT